jgi:hypothetical protein
VEEEALAVVQAEVEREDIARLAALLDLPLAQIIL